MPVTLTAPGRLAAQEDIESQRPGSEEPGFSGSVGLDLSQYSGNIDYQGLAVTSRTDLIRKRAKFFALLKLNQGWAQGEQYEDEGLVAVREVRRTDRRLRWEAFAQIDFNTPRRLDFRWLAGAGVRVALKMKPVKEPLWPDEFTYQQVEEEGWSSSRFWYGSSLMFEHEDLDLGPDDVHPVTTDVVRWSNYLSLRGTTPVDWSWTTYVQPRVDGFDDYRVLSNGSVAVDLTKHFGWNITVGGRYDSKPPDGVRKTDWSIESGLTIKWARSK